MLLNGCPAIVVPVKTGCPLIAWDTMTLDSLYKIREEAANEEAAEAKLEGVITVLVEYLSLCVDWDRVIIPSAALATDSTVMGDTQTQDMSAPNIDSEAAKKEALRDAVGVLIAGAVKSSDNKAVKKDVYLDRAGIAMLRVP